MQRTAIAPRADVTHTEAKPLWGVQVYAGRELTLRAILQTTTTADSFPRRTPLFALWARELRWKRFVSSVHMK